MSSEKIYAGTRFLVSFVSLVDQSGDAVDTEAHLHVQETDGSLTRYTRADGEITYSEPGLDPVTGAAVVNRYDCSMLYNTPGNRRAQWHFPDIEYAAKQLVLPINGPAITEPVT